MMSMDSQDETSSVHCWRQWELEGHFKAVDFLKPQRPAPPPPQELVSARGVLRRPPTPDLITL